VPGRLLHVRFPMGGHGGACVDLLGVYQHAWTHDAQLKDQSSVLSRRHAVWTALAKTIAQMPVCNALYALGDFNTDVMPLGALVGRGVLSGQSPKPDADELMSIIQQMELVVLNTWRSCKPSVSATYVREDQHTQIDFVITRRRAADCQAKLARVVPNLNFSPLEGGGRHRAAQASVPLPGWSPPRRRAASVGYDKARLEAAMRNSPQDAAELQRLVALRVATCPTGDIESLNHALLDVCCQMFPSTVRQAQASKLGEVCGHITSR
jgi:hypothetical protein